MNKKELLKTLKQAHNERRDKALIAAEKMYDWLKDKRCGKEYLTGTRHEPCYFIEGHNAVVTYLNYRTAIVELTPFSAQADIGTGYAGGTLRMDFN